MGGGKEFCIPDSLLNWKTNTGEAEFVEKDPTGRYIRYEEVLSKGVFKTVYKAFDVVDGIEVAWNLGRIDVVKWPEGLERLYSEVQLLKTLKHENIVKFYNSWVDDNKKTFNIITELFTSGSLRQYRQKHKNVDMKVIKNWAKQILQGLNYLHNHDPPIVHRDLKGENIFVNGNHGEIKIGDFGSATILQWPIKTFVGTPEFMAPELYDEEYNELVDIYSFGMCILEMVTLECPYNECTTVAQIYNKVISGTKPESLKKVNNQQVKQFIESCLAPASLRLPAKELLKDPFLQLDDSKELDYDSLPVPSFTPVGLTETGSHSMEVDADYGVCQINDTNSTGVVQFPTFEIQRATIGNEFSLSGERNHTNGDNSISLSLKFGDGFGVRAVDFLFYLDTDTAVSIATEMAEDLDLADEDVVLIAQLIDNMIMRLVPWWIPSVDYSSSGTRIRHENSQLNGGFREEINTHPETGNSFGNTDKYTFRVRRGSGLAQGEDHESQTSSIVSANSAEYSSNVVERGRKLLKRCFSEVDIGPTDHHMKENDSNINDWVEGTVGKNFEITVVDSNNLHSDPTLPSLENDEDTEFKMETNAIESQYKQQFEELSRMKEEALEEAKKKCLVKKPPVP